MGETGTRVRPSLSPGHRGRPERPRERLSRGGGSSQNSARLAAQTLAGDVTKHTPSRPKAT